MIAADDFHCAGGFSTDCVFGNDTQFMLRAYFHLPLRTVGSRFLYIRRDRWESLTNAAETGMNNPVRIARDRAWRSDFEAVKARRLRLEDSSLMAVDGQGGWTLRPLPPLRSRGSIMCPPHAPYVKELPPDGCPTAESLNHPADPIIGRIVLALRSGPSRRRPTRTGN